MKKKKAIIIVILAFCAILVCLAVNLLIGSHPKTSFKKYEKFTIVASIMFKDKKGVLPTIITTQCDGENTLLKSNKVKGEGYIIDKKFYYSNDLKIYSLGDIDDISTMYDVLTKKRPIDKTKESAGKAFYTSVFDAKDTTILLKSLFISGAVNEDSSMEIIAIDEELSEFKIDIANVEGYGNLAIDIKVIEEDDNFKLNVSKIKKAINSKPGSSPNELIIGDNNPYEIEKQQS